MPFGRLGYGSSDHDAPASSGMDLGGNSAFLPAAPDAAAGGSSDATLCAASLVDDELTCELAEGSFDGVAWAGDHLQLSPDRTSGVFTSRVFDLGAVPGDAAFSWMPRAPYGKPLPDGGASETGYQEGGVDMTGNVLLLHLDQAELGNGRLVTDASGRENHAVMVTGGEVARSQPGRFGSAVADSAASYFYLHRPRRRAATRSQHLSSRRGARAVSTIQGHLRERCG